VEARRGLVTRALVALCACMLAGPALAAAATGEEVRALAQRAQSNPAALERLRSITVVDGRRVDLRDALRTTDRGDLRARLSALGRSAGAAPVMDARAQAHAILHERRFRGSSVPRPFHGALVWLGKKLEPVGRAFHRLARRVPGGEWTLWLILAAFVVALSSVGAARVAKRRGVQALELGERQRLPPGLDPRRLEREADEAEATGDLGRALRLRFRAGLLRLGRARVVPMRESLTSGEARRILRLPEFDSLARTHDEVVYGGRPARTEDTAAAREHWPQVLAAKGVRA
jgi:hypothetical protein